jgi:hypothetical protein
LVQTALGQKNLADIDSYSLSLLMALHMWDDLPKEAESLRLPDNFVDTTFVSTPIPNTQLDSCTRGW